jgi:hypothetical protein
MKEKDHWYVEKSMETGISWEGQYRSQKTISGGGDIRTNKISWDGK